MDELTNLCDEFISKHDDINMLFLSPLKGKMNPIELSFFLIKYIILKYKISLIHQDENGKTPLIIYIEYTGNNNAKLCDDVIISLIDDDKKVLDMVDDQERNPLLTYFSCFGCGGTDKTNYANCINILYTETSINKQDVNGDTPLLLFLKNYTDYTQTCDNKSILHPRVPEIMGKLVVGIWHYIYFSDYGLSKQDVMVI
jgi:hypothetical protein